MIIRTFHMSPTYGPIWTLRDNITGLEAWGLTQTEALMALSLRNSYYAGLPTVRDDVVDQLELDL
jgi:hypothetical protein